MAFHPIQVIPQVFNPGGFGPPRSLTSASTCPWLDHSASGLERATIPPLFGLAFAGFPTRVNLATHRKLAGSFFKRHAVTTVCASTYSDAPTACRHTVSGTISLRSRGTFHHSLTVLSTIGHQGIFGLSGWSRQIHTRDFSFVLLRCLSNEPYRFQLRGSYPLRRTFRMSFAYPYGF